MLKSSIRAVSLSNVILRLMSIFISCQIPEIEVTDREELFPQETTHTENKVTAINAVFKLRRFPLLV